MLAGIIMDADLYCSRLYTLGFYSNDLIHRWLQNFDDLFQIKNTAIFKVKTKKGLLSTTCLIDIPHKNLITGASYTTMNTVTDCSIRVSWFKCDWFLRNLPGANPVVLKYKVIFTTTASPRAIFVDSKSRECQMWNSRHFEKIDVAPKKSLQFVGA